MSSNASPTRQKRRATKNREKQIKLWNFVPDGATFQIVRTPQGWDGSLSIPGGPTIERRGHTPSDVVGALVWNGLKLARGEQVTLKIESGEVVAT